MATGYENPSVITSEPELQLGLSAFGENTVKSTADTLFAASNKEPTGLTPFNIKKAGNNDMLGEAGEIDGLLSRTNNGEAGLADNDYGNGDIVTPYIKPTREIIAGALKKAPMTMDSNVLTQNGNIASTSRPQSRSPSTGIGSNRQDGGAGLKNVEYMKDNFYLNDTSRKTKSGAQTPKPQRMTPRPSREVPVRNPGMSDTHKYNNNNNNNDNDTIESSDDNDQTMSQKRIMRQSNRDNLGPMKRSEIESSIESTSSSFKESEVLYYGTKTAPSMSIKGSAIAKSPQQMIMSVTSPQQNSSYKPKTSSKIVLDDSGSMSVFAETIRRDLVNRRVKLTFTPFADSRILTRDTSRLVYYCIIDYFQRKLVRPRLLWSIHSMGKGMSSMHAVIDANGATVVIVKSGTRVFGGFAAESWNTLGVPFGEKGGSFLFSTDNDKILKYRGGICLMGTYGSIVFGNGDLILSDDFESNFSELGNSYSYTGMSERERATLLAGSEQFDVDDVEIYAFDN